LVLTFVATSQDQTGGTLATLTAGGTLSSTLVVGSGTDVGNGGVLNIFEGVMATPGATGTQTGTLSGNSQQVRYLLAIPPVAPPSGGFSRSRQLHRLAGGRFSRSI